MTKSADFVGWEAVSTYEMDTRYGWICQTMKMHMIPFMMKTHNNANFT